MDVSRGELPARRDGARRARIGASDLSHFWRGQSQFCTRPLPGRRRHAFRRLAYARIAYVFDGRDQEAVARARAEWQAAKAKGHAVSYWQQTEQGRWQQM